MDTIGLIIGINATITKKLKKYYYKMRNQTKPPNSGFFLVFFHVCAIIKVKRSVNKLHITKFTMDSRGNLSPAITRIAVQGDNATTKLQFTIPDMWTGLTAKIKFKEPDFSEMLDIDKSITLTQSVTSNASVQIQLLLFDGITQIAQSTISTITFSDSFDVTGTTDPSNPPSIPIDDQLRAQAHAGQAEIDGNELINKNLQGVEVSRVTLPGGTSPGGGVSIDDVTTAIGAHNANQIAHTDIREDIDGLSDTVSQISLSFSTADLYFKQSGIMNQDKPIGTGQVLNSGKTLNSTTEQLIFDFSYSSPQDFILYANNRYRFNIPYVGMTNNRRVIVRYLYTIGAHVVADVTRPEFIIPSNGTYTEAFEVINNLTDNKSIITGEIIRLQIFAKTTGQTTPISMLISDVDNMARLSRNEITAGQAATNVFTNARGVTEPLESVLIDLYDTTIGENVGSNFVLKIQKTGLNFLAENAQYYNLMTLFTFDDVVTIFGREQSDYALENNLLRLPISRNDPLVAYDITLRLSGAYDGAPATREINILMRRADNSTISTLPIIKIGAYPLENRAVTFNTFTLGNDDPVIQSGFKFVLSNQSGINLTITGLELLIMGSDE